MDRKKRAVLAALLCALSLGAPAAIQAKTVHYKGVAVYWNYGRNAKVFGFSDCNSGVYSHRSSVNGYTTDWMEPGKMSKAWKYIGSATLEAYWDCRG